MNDPQNQMPHEIQPTQQPQRSLSLVEDALEYVRTHGRVLPLHSVLPGGGCTCGDPSCHSVAKHPLTKNGVKDASCDPEQIRDWWRRYPYANIGIATGAGTLVIDIDPQHGGSLEALNAIVPLPPTTTTSTGGGGLHLYFSYDRSRMVRNSTGKLAPGIDVRGENGYVVAPPSIHVSGNRYRKLPGYTCQPAPAALLDLVAEKGRYFYLSDPDPLQTIPTSSPAPITPPALVAPTPSLPAASVDTPAAVEEDARFIPEGKRNSTLVSIAGSLRNQGATEAALWIVLQALSQGCCRPPLPENELRQICKSACAWIPGVNGHAPSVPMIVKHVAILMTQEFPPARWSIPDLLPEGVSLLAGKPKMGKSWLALSLAISIAQGDKALGSLPTNQGDVLYMGLEDNEPRLCTRMRKLLQDASTPQALYWTSFCPPLSQGGLSTLEDWISSAKCPRLVVIDTLARVRSQPVISNGSVYADDYAAIVPLKHLAEQYHLSILLIHHLRKSGASDPMDEVSGSTGLTGATDCNMVLQRERGQNRATLHVTGRDVEDQEINMQFDPQSGLWSIHSGLSDRNHETRDAIISLLQSNNRPLSPAEIADQLALERSSVRKKLSLMKKDDQVEQVNRGWYQIRQTVPSTNPDQ